MTTWPALPHQLGQQVELLARELELAAAEAGDPGARVELDARRPGSASAGASVAAGAAPQHGADPRDHLGGAEGLDHVVVGAELEADDLVHLGAARGQHHDRHVGAAAQLAADVAAVAVGQGQVEHHQVRFLAGGELQGAGRGRGHQRLEARPAQRLGEGLGDRLLVLDDEDAPAGRLPGHAATVAALEAASRRPRGGFASSLPAACPALAPAVRTMARQLQPGGRSTVKSLRTRIAAVATVVGLGGLAGLALSAGQQHPSPAVAEKPIVRTKVIRRTIHVTKHAKPKHPAGGAGGWGGAARQRRLGGGGSYGSATTGASSSGSSPSSPPLPTRARSPPRPAAPPRSRSAPARARVSSPVVTRSSGSKGSRLQGSTASRRVTASSVVTGSSGSHAGGSSGGAGGSPVVTHDQRLPRRRGRHHSRNDLDQRRQRRLGRRQRRPRSPPRAAAAAARRRRRRVRRRRAGAATMTEPPTARRSAAPARALCSGARSPSSRSSSRSSPTS